MYQRLVSGYVLGMCVWVQEGREDRKRPKASSTLHPSYMYIIKMNFISIFLVNHMKMAGLVLPHS
jgi:hypothetical protein